MGDEVGWKNPLILTIDPNFVGHPSGCYWRVNLVDYGLKGVLEDLVVNQYIQRGGG